MTEKEVYQMVKSVGLPAAYHHFEEGKSPDPPFLVYLYPETNNFAADGIVYQDINQLDIELYTDKKDLEAEKRVEAVLKEHGLFYEKNWVGGIGNRNGNRLFFSHGITAGK